MRKRPPHAVTVIVAAALGVALTLVGMAALRDSGEPAGTAAGPAAEPTVLGDEVLGLDRGQLGEAAALETCSTPRFAGRGPVEVLYGVRQLAADGEAPVVVLRNEAGELRLCDAAGADSPSQAPLPAPDAAAPVAFLNARVSWECTGNTLDRYTSASWLLVDDRVVTVRQRLWVDGDPGPWFTTEAVDGIVHLAAWEDGPLPPGTDLGVEFDVLDRDGAAVPQGVLPVDPAAVGWCEDGDVQIG